jgi:N-methylhydantoinase A
VASGYLRVAGIAEAHIGIALRLDMRYHGQGYEIEVTLPATDDFAALRTALWGLFERRYAEVFSDTFPEEPLEIMTWKVEATGPETLAAQGYAIAGKADGDAAASVEAARKGARPAYVAAAGAYVATPVYDRMKLAPGAEVRGQAVIEERESTCVIGPGDLARVDAHHNLVVELEPLAASSG